MCRNRQVTANSGLVQWRDGGVTMRPVPARGDAVTVSSYILIQTEVGKASDVVAAVRSLPGVVQADDVTGPYDVILRAEASSIDELGRMVVSQIQLVDGITRTLTCPVVHL
jgi:DNA-binding Lrp family transcriptional regulator